MWAYLKKAIFFTLILFAFNPVYASELMSAVEQNQLELVKELVNKGADLNYQNAEGMTPLIVAVQKGDYHIVSALLGAPGVPLDSKINLQLEDFISDGTALIHASGRGYKNIVELLLNKGADLNYQNRHNISALMVASHLDQRDIVQLLTEQQGIALNLKDKNGNTALMFAVRTNNKDVVQKLVLAGAHLDIEDNNTVTPLMVASVRNYTEIVQTLVEGGADLNHKHSGGVTVLSVAIIYSNIYIVQALIEAPTANLNHQDNEGKNPLMVAAGTGRKDVVEKLIEYQVQLNLKDKDGKTALIHAEEAGHVEIAQILAEAMGSSQ